jgi:hypothetical protein
MTTFTKQISVDADDGYDTGAGAFASNDGIVVGNNGATQVTVGVRFTAVTIPQGVTVTSATLTLVSSGGDTGTPGTVTLKGIASDNCADFSTTAPSVASKTSASATAPHGGADGTSYGVTVTSIVQEILSRAGWTSGNAIGFAGAGPGTTSGLNFAAYHDVSTNSAKAASLSVTFTNVAITPANAAQGQASSSPTLGAKSTLTPANAAQSQASTSPTVAAKSTITANAAAQAHASTSPTITSSVVSPANAAQGHSSTSPSIATNSTLAPVNAAQAHSSTSPTLTAKSTIVPANAAQAQTSTSPTLAFVIPAIAPASRIVNLAGDLAGRTITLTVSGSRTVEI